MKLIKIINAYDTAEKLSELSGFSKDDQWSLYKLRKSLRDHYNFKQEQEKKIGEKYVQYANDEGVITGEPFMNYKKDITDLYNMEIEYTPEEEITLPIVDGFICPYMEALEDFVTLKN